MNSTAHQTHTASSVSSAYGSSPGVDLDRAQPKPERPTVLIVDDDADTVALLKTALRNEGMDVVGATDGFQALQKFGDVNPDIVLLDLMMPDLDGWETYRRLRKLSDVPIVIISAKASKENVVEGLEFGVDDYVTKPFHLPEVAARVRAVLRRSPAVEHTEMHIFPERELLIEPETHHVSLRGEVIELSPNEFALLNVLAEHAPRPATHEQITQAVWGEDEVQRDRIKYVVHLLRQKIEPDPSDPEIIRTRTSVGYQLDVGQTTRQLSN